MKSDQKKPSPTYINGFQCAVLTVSDRCSRGETHILPPKGGSM